MADLFVYAFGTSRLDLQLNAMRKASRGDQTNEGEGTPR